MIYCFIYKASFMIAPFKVFARTWFSVYFNLYCDSIEKLDCFSPAQNQA